MLAYNCSPSFNWKKNLDDATIAKFQRELGAMGYKFQFITLAGFHQLNFGMFELARGYKDRQMSAYSELQEAEFAAEVNGYTATKHQREVGTGYFDAVSLAITGGKSSTTAMKESTEHGPVPPGGRVSPIRTGGTAQLPPSIPDDQGLRCNARKGEDHGTADTRQGTGRGAIIGHEYRPAGCHSHGRQ